MTTTTSEKVRGKLDDLSDNEVGIQQTKRRKGVRAEVATRVKEGRDDLAFGFVEKEWNASHWFLGNCGSAKWIVSKHPEKVTQREDPLVIDPDGCDLNDLVRRDPVDVLMFVDRILPLEDETWQSGYLKCVMWLCRRRPNGGFKIGKGWKVSTERISHNEVGGVTNKVMWMGIALKEKGGLKWNKSRRSIPNVLRQVIDPTNGGRQVVKISDQQRCIMNTAKGLLEWKNRFGNVTVPTVYSKDKWVKRKLSSKELCDVLDIPGGITSQISENRRKQLIDLPAPGKIFQHIVRGLVKDQYWPKGHDDIGGGVKRKCEEGFKVNALKDMKSFKRLKEDKSLREVEALMEDSLTKSTVTAKAVKDDGASVPIRLWNDKIKEACSWLVDRSQEGRNGEHLLQRSLDLLRGRCLKWWKKRVIQEYLEWHHGTGHVSDERMDIDEWGEAMIEQVKRASWWEWQGGSTPFFWRWPKSYQQDLKDGIPARFDKNPPYTWESQPACDSKERWSKVRKKVEKVVNNGYVKFVGPEDVRSLMHMFDVPKGESDIRMVYDGSKSGLNDSTWAPWFSLPTVETMCRTLEPGFWCADNDYGEHFLNFPLSPELQQYCGLDLTQIFPEKAEEVEDLLTAVWVRNAMGLKQSPHAAVQGSLRAKTVIRSNVGLASAKELTGSAGYDSLLVWLAKIDEEGLTAAELHQCVDDLRITASTKELAWRASSRVAKICSYLGLQDAARKRREPSQEPGAWAGAVVSTLDGQVTKSVTQERWDKTKRRIAWLAREAGVEPGEKGFDEDALEEASSLGAQQGPEGHMHHKTAEKYRGFLVCVSRTHTSMVPFLKGLHLTLESWRPDRDEDGWRLSNTVDYRLNYDTKRKPPQFVKMVPRFKGDMEILMNLTRHEHPPKVRIRPTSHTAAFLVGDASGAGFGSTLWSQGDEEFDANYGGWTMDVSNASSNEREAYNLTLSIEAGVDNGTLQPGMELFVFTDNMVSERCFHSGRSRSRAMHALVIKMHDLVMRGDLFVHFVWISGERMKNQGTDGLSRGDETTGVMAGDDFLSHVPLNESALERCPSLKTWLDTALPGDDWTLLDEEGWFRKACDDPEGKYTWAQMCEVRHTHPRSSHVFLCPAIMTIEWRKQLRKLNDSMITVKEGAPIWPTEMLEPLVLSLTSPLLNHRPWSMHRSEWLASRKSVLSDVFGSSASAGRSYLCEFWTRAWAGETDVL